MDSSVTSLVDVPDMASIIYICDIEALFTHCHRKCIDRFASTSLLDAFSTGCTKTFENGRIARCDVS